MNIIQIKKIKKLSILLIITLFSLNTYAQIKFEKGYFINNSNQKTECLIRNVDWNNTPTDFRYKLTERASIEKQSITSVKEFGIYNISKYIRATVDMARSNGRVLQLKEGRAPIFIEEQLFLKVIIEGKANLFLYEENDLTRFFYNENESKIEQLIYKEYLLNIEKTVGNNDFNELKIAENNDYKTQLYDNLKCEELSLQNYKELKYTRKELSKIFIAYNLCKDSNYKSYKKPSEKFRVNLRLHANRASISVAHPSINFRNADFENHTYFGLGAEVEYVLPYNTRKWTLFTEPTYKMFNYEQEKDVSTLQGGKLISKIDYKFLEIPIGLRHKMFLNDKSKFFINACYIVNVDLNSSIKFERANGSELNTLKAIDTPSLGLGTGYEYNNKYSLELRLLTTRILLGNDTSWVSKISAVSVILGYNLF